MRDAVRNTETWKGRRAPTQDPSTELAAPICNLLQWTWGGERGRGAAHVSEATGRGAHANDSTSPAHDPRAAGGPVCGVSAPSRVLLLRGIRLVQVACGRVLQAQAPVPAPFCEA